jgi:hypothetical protein
VKKPFVRRGRGFGCVSRQIAGDASAKLVIADVVSAGTDHLEAIRQLARGMQRGQRRQEVAGGEIAGGAEKDERLDQSVLIQCPCSQLSWRLQYLPQ